MFKNVIFTAALLLVSLLMNCASVHADNGAADKKSMPSLQSKQMADEYEASRGSELDTNIVVDDKAKTLVTPKDSAPETKRPFTLLQSKQMADEYEASRGSELDANIVVDDKAKTLVTPKDSAPETKRPFTLLQSKQMADEYEESKGLGY